MQLSALQFMVCLIIICMRCSRCFLDMYLLEVAHMLVHSRNIYIAGYVLSEHGIHLLSYSLEMFLLLLMGLLLRVAS